MQRGFEGRPQSLTLSLTLFTYLLYCYLLPLFTALFTDYLLAIYYGVELATLEWVDWFNHQRLLEPIGYIPPVEAEAQYYRQLANTDAASVT